MNLLRGAGCIRCGGAGLAGRISCGGGIVIRRSRRGVQVDEVVVRAAPSAARYDTDEPLRFQLSDVDLDRAQAETGTLREPLDRGITPSGIVGMICQRQHDQPFGRPKVPVFEDGRHQADAHATILPPARRGIATILEASFAEPATWRCPWMHGDGSRIIPAWQGIILGSIRKPSTSRILRSDFPAPCAAGVCATTVAWFWSGR